MSKSFIPIEPAILSWSDGLPFSETFNDIYFSTENGLAEKHHVFIEGNQLLERWSALENSYFVIAETGFGSALNFLLTGSLWLTHAPKSARLHYFSCEKFPLTKVDLQRCLKLWPQLQSFGQEIIDNYPILTPGFHQLHLADGRINLSLMLGEAADCYKQLLVCGDFQLEQQLRGSFVDAWFLDGFSPTKNQAMWSKDLLEIIALLSKPGTTLATYSAAALVKESIKSAGFILQKRKGFGQKRSMLTAQFTKLEFNNRKLRSTPWHVSEPKQSKNKNAIVIGAGLAGCYTAFSLAKRGWQVKLIDENSEPGQGASGNKQAVLYPKLSLYRSPFTQFMLSAFLYACRVYRQLLTTESIGLLSGILQLAFNEEERLSQENLKNWLSAYPELARLVDADEASELTGIKLEAGGLFINHSGWIDSEALCSILVNTDAIQWVPNTQINELIFNEGFWHAGDQKAEVLVLANGHKATQFQQTKFLPLKTIRGQMTMIAANEQSLKLKIPLCGDGHILPAQTKIHSFGASYHLNNEDTNPYSADDLANLDRLAKMPTALDWENEIKTNWVGLRGATTDYLPLVGPVPDFELFNSRFTSVSTNAKRWIPSAGAYLPGLFLCAGFGSRGLTTIPLSAEWLASAISNEPAQIPQSMVQALAPARFLLKKLIRGYT